jgi:hypothetical protein
MAGRPGSSGEACSCRYLEQDRGQAPKQARHRGRDKPVVRMSALLDGRAGVCNIAPVLLYVGLAIACLNLLAVVVIARLGQRLSGTSHEVLPRAAGASSTRAAQRARVRPAAPRQSRRRAARAPAP